MARPDSRAARRDTAGLDTAPRHFRPRPARSGRIVLLGDAAHSMAPFRAQGGCQAFEEAAVLAAELTGTVESARLSRNTIGDAARGCSAWPDMIRGSACLSTSPLGYGLLTRFTRIVGGGVAAREAVRLWNWTLPTSRHREEKFGRR
ncbi:FAD-dependent monooxygenase [Nocardia sp. NPDC050412]|uniref:FAD-dependent monooxygenase n=1 Tax=Nocardia sp. NPDC050412 TaxID=3364320 RepID=UPI003788257C